MCEGVALLSQTSETRGSPAILATLLALILGCQATAEVDGARAQADVLNTLRDQGEVPVIVALAEPAGYGDQGVDMDRIRADIARMQAEVLASLDSADYRSRNLFASIPAMAGVIRSERGLRRLLASPHVERIDVDAEGTGAR